MEVKELKNWIENSDSIEKDRYFSLLKEAEELFGEGDYHFVSSPGRSEIGGNHTDHQLGHILAATLDIDNLAVFKRREDLKVCFIDRKLGKIELDLSDLSVKEEEKNTSASLVRGIAAYLKQDFNIEPQGFEALCDPRVLIGSGISSSACFELMIAYILAYFAGKDETEDYYSGICSRAENNYFGKPSGQMDQYAIENGGLTAIDFSNMTIEQIPFSFKDYGYHLVLVNTKGSHDNLSDEYGKMPLEMKDVARELGVDVLSKTSLEELLKHFNEIRGKLDNDRALLRAIHFFLEDPRAVQEKEAAKAGDIDTFLHLIRESGRSSYMYLQNVYIFPKHQNLSLALALSEVVLKEEGAYRVHGGGLEGTIQAIVPDHLLQEYIRVLGDAFGEDAVLCVDIREKGTCIII
ncbi:MAG: galactokinase [Erysipelotrichaceae bacterium]|nr:galactokinase [Erysipelotrichaceae bacterium]